MDITICQHQNQTDNDLCSQRWRISIQSVKTRPGVDCCGSDHELLVAKFRLKLKKVEKTTRSFRYDLNQIPYDLEMLTRFTRLDLVDVCLKNYGWMFIFGQEEAVTKTMPKKKKCRKAKWLSEEALQIAEERREEKGKVEKERYTQRMQSSR